MSERVSLCRRAENRFSAQTLSKGNPLMFPNI